MTTNRNTCVEIDFAGIYSINTNSVVRINKDFSKNFCASYPI